MIKLGMEAPRGFHEVSRSRSQPNHSQGQLHRYRYGGRHVFQMVTDVSVKDKVSLGESAFYYIDEVDTHTLS